MTLGDDPMRQRYRPEASERAFAGSVPTIGDWSRPAHGQGLAAGHQAGLPARYSEAGSVRVAIDELHITALFTVS